MPTPTDLPTRLRSRAWEDRQHRALREEAADELVRLYAYILEYVNADEDQLATIERLQAENQALRAQIAGVIGFVPSCVTR